PETLSKSWRKIIALPRRFGDSESPGDAADNINMPSPPKKGRGVLLFLVNHLSRHPAVQDEIRAGDEPRAFAVEQECDHLGNVLRPADPADGMLQVVLAPQLLVRVGHDPAGTHAIDPNIRAEVDRQGLGQRQEAALG